MEKGAKELHCKMLGGIYRSPPEHGGWTLPYKLIMSETDLIDLRAVLLTVMRCLVTSEKLLRNVYDW